MMIRRYFIVVASMLILTIGVAAPVKSLVGAKEIGSAENAEGWENPYVTDGLIAMYDGEWNLAGGKHTTQKVCNNIVSNLWHGQVGSAVVIGDNYFGFNGTVGETYAINLGKDWFGKFPHMTFEVCFVSEGSGAQSNQSAFGGSEGIDNAGMSFFRNSAYCMTSLATGAPSSRTWSYGFSWLADQTKHSISFRVGEDSSFVSCDNIKKGAKSGRSIDWTKPVLDCHIGCDATSRSPEYSLNGKVFCVRVYNKALTEEEIAYNYSIDKERFGLP